MYVEHTQIRSRLCGAAVHFCFSLVCVRSSRVPVPGPNGLAPRAPVLLLVVIPDRTQLNVYVLYTHLQRTFERHRSTLRHNAEPLGEALVLWPRRRRRLEHNLWEALVVGLAVDALSRLAHARNRWADGNHLVAERRREATH